MRVECRWNLYGQPNSWFDIFVEDAPPSDLAEWRNVGEPGEFAPLNFSQVSNPGAAR